MSKIEFDLSSTLGTSDDGRTTGTQKSSGVIPKVGLDLSNTLGIARDGRKVGSEMKGVVPKGPCS